MYIGGISGGNALNSAVGSTGGINNIMVSAIDVANATRTSEFEDTDKVASRALQIIPKSNGADDVAKVAQDMGGATNALAVGMAAVGA